MASTTYSFRSRDTTFFGSIRWDRAIQSGLIVGGITFLLSRGIPWVGSGAIDPAVMGREIAPGESPSAFFFLSIMALHFVVSVLYAIILAPIVHGFKSWVAGAVGGVAGLVLYFINYALAGMFMELGDGEWPPIVLHVIFGIVCAETYKGLVRRQPPAPLM